jgi:hypothetical protein
MLTWMILYALYCSCIRTVLEFVCQLFHSTKHLSDEIECMQKELHMQIILPGNSYSIALAKARRIN